MMIKPTTEKYGFILLNKKKSDLKNDNKGQFGGQDVPVGHRILVLPRTTRVVRKVSTVSECKQKNLHEIIKCFLIPDNG